MTERYTEKQTPLQKTLTIVGLVLCIVFGFMLICNITIIVKGTIHPEMPPSVLGVTPMVTLSSSMDGDQEDSFAAGDLIFVGKTEPEALKVGDVIAFILSYTNHNFHQFFFHGVFLEHNPSSSFLQNISE